ncbi:GCS-domain-containing protein [Ceratobasidium sp. AG-I]|nr:GCS-domain-containing protein [Ceratobasidium sp. AG-I]
MGQLFQGAPLSWEESQKYADYIRQHGITQLLNIWKKQKYRQNDPFLWGDEIECTLISYDDNHKNARVSLRQSEVLEAMRKVDGAMSVAKEFQPEYSRFMIETTPQYPYDGSIANLLSVESNMQHRRSLAKSYLKPHETLLTLTSFPRLGVRETFTDPPTDPNNARNSHSMLFSDEIIAPHPRYSLITRNIRQRRGSKPTINVPIYFDTQTPRPFYDPTIPLDRCIYPEDREAGAGAAKPDHIYLDAPGFGASCCCLQVTFQAPDVLSARSAYDALIPVAPILMALTAASPAYRGYLSDVDCRWGILRDGQDDRTREEKGLEPLKKDKRLIPKSRYGSVNMYISQNAANRPEYNDVPVPFDRGLYKRLRRNDIDRRLAKHFAHIFIRDPLFVFSDPTSVDDSRSTEHFDNLQGTVWQSLRFKPPPLRDDNQIGWRVEFRTMEVQPTDFENAAFAMFVVLLARAILSLGLNFYMPVSKVDENMERAQKRDAAQVERFWFRTVEGVCEELTMDEVINGKGEFLGLLGYVNVYLTSLEEDVDEKMKLKPYLELIKTRANGTVKTPATWIRNFVRAHPAYKFDSVVSQEINYDLMKTLEKM